MSFFWREYVYRLPGVRRVTRVNFRGGSVRQSLWIKSAAPVLTFTIVVNYSEFFPRRFIPTVVAASRSYPPPPPSVYSFSFLLSLLASLFFLFYLSVSALVRFFFYRPAALASSEGCTSSSGHRTSCSSNRRRRLAIKLYSISWTPRRAFREVLWCYLFVGLY